MLGPIMLVVVMAFIFAAAAFERRQERRRALAEAAARFTERLWELTETFKAIPPVTPLIVESLDRLRVNLEAYARGGPPGLADLPVVESNLVPPGTAFVLGGDLLDAPIPYGEFREFDWGQVDDAARRYLFMQRHLVVHPDPEDRSVVKIIGLDV